MGVGRAACCAGMRRVCVCSYLEDQREVRVEALLELLRLGARHLVAREVEDLLREELQDDHVVLA